MHKVKDFWLQIKHTKVFFLTFSANLHSDQWNIFTLSLLNLIQHEVETLVGEKIPLFKPRDQASSTLLKWIRRIRSILPDLFYAS